MIGFAAVVDPCLVQVLWLQDSFSKGVLGLQSSDHEHFVLRTALWNLREERIVVTADIHHSLLDTVKGCFFHRISKDASPNITISSEARMMSMPPGGAGFVIDCGFNFPGKGESDRFLDLQTELSISLNTGASIGPVAVEVVDEVSRGDIVICVGMFYTSNPIIYRWLDHYRALGVDHFRIYYTVSEGGPTGMGHPAPLYGKPTTTFDAEDVTWHFTGKGNHGPVFSMHMFLTDCVHRYKYSYKYVMVIDPDEFLVLNRSLHGYPRLSKVVDSFLPDSQAETYLKICRRHYSRTCPKTEKLNGMDLAQDYTTPHFFNHWKRDPEPDCPYGKSISRPYFVDSMWAHAPHAWSAGAKGRGRGGLGMPVSKGYLQHWSSRRVETRQDLDLTDCSKLQDENETFISPIWFN
jgi:Glycosyltransferase family 92